MTKSKIHDAVISGTGIAGMSNDEVIELYLSICKQWGLVPETFPIDILERADRKTGKVVKTLYINKIGASQLARNIGATEKGIDIEETEHLVTAKVLVEDKDGRCAFGLGAAPLSIARVGSDGNHSYLPIVGKDRANAYMVAATKAARRAVMQLSGLALAGEGDEQNIPDAKVRPVPRKQDIPAPPPPPELSSASMPHADALRAVMEKHTPPPDIAKKFLATLRGQSPEFVKERVLAFDKYYESKKQKQNDK